MEYSTVFVPYLNFVNVRHYHHLSVASDHTEGASVFFLQSKNYINFAFAVEPGPP